MSWHMLGTQYEHAGAPDDGPCPSCEVVRLRTELAALREERDRLRDGARKGWDANMALSRDLATARNSQKHDWRAREYWRERATAAEADNERARALLARARDQL